MKDFNRERSQAGLPAPAHPLEGLECPDTPPDEPVYDALSPDLCGQFLLRLKASKDPDTDKRMLGLRQVYAVFPEDRRGLVEVLYVVNDGPQFINGRETAGLLRTAFFRGGELAWTEEGW